MTGAEFVACVLFMLLCSAGFLITVLLSDAKDYEKKYEKKFADMEKEMAVKDLARAEAVDLFRKSNGEVRRLMGEVNNLNSEARRRKQLAIQMFPELGAMEPDSEE